MRFVLKETTLARRPSSEKKEFRNLRQHEVMLRSLQIAKCFWMPSQATQAHGFRTTLRGGLAGEGPAFGSAPAESLEI